MWICVIFCIGGSTVVSFFDCISVASNFCFSFISTNITCFYFSRLPDKSFITWFLRFPTASECTAAALADVSRFFNDIMNKRLCQYSICMFKSISYKEHLTYFYVICLYILQKSSKVHKKSPPGKAVDGDFLVFMVRLMRFERTTFRVGV